MNFKEKNFKEFKKFLAEKCSYLKMYKEGKYDRKIYNWFRMGKPVKVEFYNKDGKKVYFKGRTNF